MATEGKDYQPMVGEGSNQPESGEQKQGQQPESALKADFDRVSQELAQAKAKLAESETLKGELSRLQQRMEQMEDEFVRGLDTQSAGKTPASPPPQLDLTELTTGEAAIVRHFQGQLDGLREYVASRETTARSDVDRKMALQLEVEAIKRENPETWELVSPRATELCRQDPRLTVREAWVKAKAMYDPLFEAKAVVDKQRTEEAKQAASEKPGGPAGGQPKKTPQEVFGDAWASSGLPE